MYIKTPNHFTIMIRFANANVNACNIPPRARSRTTMNALNVIPHCKNLTEYTTEVIIKMWFEERDNDNAEVNNDQEVQQQSSHLTTPAQY